MVSKRRGKRKSASKDYVFEVSDDDVSTDNSDNECNEPEKKLLKSDSKFVESVVNALSNLENEAKQETKTTEKTDIIEILDESKEDCSKIVEDTDKSLFIIEDTTVTEIESGTDKICQNVDESILILETSSNNVDSNKSISQEVINSVTPNVIFDESVESEVEEGELTTEGDNVDASSNSNSIQITFGAKSLSTLYRDKFLNFLNTYTDLTIVKQDDLSITLKQHSTKPPEDLVVKNYVQTPSVPKTDPLSTPDSSSKKKKRKKNKKEKDLFVLDTNPSGHDNNFPKYSSKFQIDINENNEEEEVRVSLQTCFNCDQSHSLKDCPLPRNHAKINMMRLQFKMKKDKQPSRYHMEEEQKYAHLRPGKISDKLREALGLSENQLPPYVYSMRQLGYPPGWLDEAKFVYSNLSMFDTEGNNVRPKNVKKNLGLDPNKIIEYPGFNSPMGKNVKDEYRQYRVPPYSDDYCKNVMIQYFEKQYSKQQDDFETKDMDLGNDDGSDKEDTKLVVLRQSDTYKDAPSPSLVDLEKEKQNLLAALDDSSNSNADQSNSDLNLSLKSSQPCIEKVPAESCKNTSQTTSVNCVKTSNLGTPILRSCSDFCRLPNPDNFMKGVSPVINFENLPNSTGKYETMTGIIQKIRKTLKRPATFSS